MKTVYVGMSGGVDSSVTAALLVEQGYHVVGVYMKNWSQDLPGMKCPWAEDLADAKRVAVQLGIDFKVFDFETEYREKVVQYMIDEYKLGRTPNPDIMCNQEVKFKLFLDTALADGADLIATGHYARVSNAESQTSFTTPLQPEILPLHARENPGVKPSRKVASATTTPLAVAAETSENSSAVHLTAEYTQLLRARDDNKDQTYFLYRVTAEALSHTLFPLGGYLKSEVRELAKERGLWTATKRESMGVCFVGNVGMREFLSQFVEAVPGNIIDKQTGREVGRHDGAIFYTLGQRHGMDLGGGLPYYVVGKDMGKNEVYVSRNLADENLIRDDLILESVHWINDAPSDTSHLQARLRHRGKLINATLGGDHLKLANPERAITPGQSVVLYDGEICLGGGIVAS